MYLLLLLAITQMGTRPCTRIDGDQIVFTATSNEILTIDLQIFDKSSSDQYQLIDDSKRFQINPPIWLMESTIPQVRSFPNTITDFRVIKNEFNEWQNIFGVIGIVSDTYHFFKTILVDESINHRLPIFNSDQILHKTTETTYSEFIFIDSNTIVIDSMQKDQGNTKYIFELWTQTTPSMIENQFPSDTDGTQPRHLLNTQKYIYRWAPKTNDHSAIIQIYQLNTQEKQIKLVQTIDQTLMQELVKQTIPDYKFELVEFQVSSNDEMALIDISGNFILLHGDLQTLTIKIQQLKQQYPHSFDYNFQVKDLVVAFDQSLEYVYNNQDVIIPLPNISEYKVHQFQAFTLLVNNKQIILLNSDFEEIYRVEGDFTSSIFDFDSNDLIAIQNQKCNHYLLYPQFSLQYKSDKEKENDWIQSIIKKGDCQLRLIFRNVDQTSNVMHQYGSLPLISTALYSQQYEQPLNRLVHGPNIKTEMKQQGFVSHKVKLDIKYQQSQLLDMSLENVIFTQVYYEQTQKKSFIINQTENLKISLFACSSKIPTIECVLKLEFPAVISLLTTTPVIHYYDQVLIITYLNGLDLIIHTITIQNTQYKQQQTTERLKEEYTITQILNTDEYLLLFSPEKKLISIYNLFAIEDGELYLIDATNFAKHSNREWSPININANQDSNWLYIYSFENTAYIHIIDLHVDHFRFIFSEQIRNVDTNIVIFKKQFGVLQQELNKNIYLYLYRVDHPSRIFSEKVITMFNEQITDLKSIYASSYNSAMYVKINQTSIMTYFTEETIHNSLINIIQIEAKKIICSQSYLYLINDNQLNVLEVYRQPHLISSVQFVSNTNVFDLTEKLFYTTTLSEQVVPLQTSLRFINTQQQIYIPNENTQIQIKEANQTNNKTFLGNTWYEGQGYKFELNGSINGIELQQPLINETDPYLPFDQAGKQIIIINKNILITLYDQRFSAIDPKAPAFAKSYPFKDPIKTVSIVYNSDGYMFFQLLNNTKYEILAAKCENNTCEGNSYTLGVKGLVNDIQIINQTMFLIYQNNEIEVYSIADRLLPKEAILLGTEKINEKDQGIRVQHIYKNYYQIYSNNDEGFLNIIQIIISEQDYKSVKLQSIDLLTIANEEYYLPYENNQVFPYLDIIKKIQINEIIQIELLFYSNNDKHLGYEFTIICNETNCSFSKYKLTFVLQGYSQIVRQPQFINKQIVIPYQVNDQVLLSIYKLPAANNYDVHGQISFIGGIQILKPSKNVQYTIFETDNQTALLFYDNEILQYYLINDAPALNMNGKIDEQSFEIKISSDYDNTKATFTIKIVGDDDVNPDNQKSHMWLWIALGIVGVLIIGGLGYYFYNKNNKTEEKETNNPLI